MQPKLDLFSEMDADRFEKISHLTILSMGVGQDSVTILLKILHDDAFRRKYAPERLLVLFSDTGNESPMTYDYLDRVLKPLCEDEGVDFVHIVPEMGFHKESWRSLTHQWRTGTPTIGSVAYPKSCTHNLKLQPQYRYVERWLFENYPETVTKDSRKAGFVQFAQRYGKIRWLVGIAKGEERRVADVKNETALWKAQTIRIEYPLLAEGLGRQECQDYIRSIGREVPFPSNCLYCPYASNHMEILWLSKAYPDRFMEWVELEQAKLDAHRDAAKNLGVSGRIHKEGPKSGKAVTLLDLLEEAERKYPGKTLDELTSYRFSHGHCVVSKY